MLNWLVNIVLQFRPNNWSTNTSLCPTDRPTDFSSSCQTTGLRIQLVYNWSANTSLYPTDWLTEFQFMPNNWSTNITGLQQIYEYQFMPNRLVNGIGILKFRPNNWPTNTTGLQLVYEYQFIPNWLANGILQFLPNNWSMTTTGLQLAYKHQFIPNWLANGILQFRPNMWSTNTSLCPTNWSTEFSSSCQTTGLRIAVYAQPIGQRNSTVHAKQLVYEYQFIPSRLANGILQFRPNNWSTNTTGLQMAYEYQFIPNRLANGISSSGQTTGLRTTSLYPTDWPSEFSSSDQTACLRIPVYVQPTGQRNSSGQAKQLVYEYQFMSNRLVNGILQFRPKDWFYLV